MITALRLASGAALAWCIAAALLAPAVALPAKAAALIVAVLTFWRPTAGFAATLAVAPAGLLLARPPAQAAELAGWTFLAASLLRPGSRPTPHVDRAVAPALLFGACAAVSWAVLTLPGAAGIAPLALPLFFARAIPLDHLAWSSAEPHTWTLLQLAAGLALYVAGARLGASTAEARRLAAWALVVAGAGLAVTTAADVLRQWSEHGYGSWYLLRYVRGERFSLHMRDLNAAGSVYVLTGLIALVLAVADPRRRGLWIAACALMSPALWLSGSRSAAIGAMLVGATVVPLARGRLRPRAVGVAAALALLIAVVTAAGVAAIARDAPEEGSAAHALRLRSMFLVTSARMFASAPVYGVGLGQYHERSAVFMPAGLRAVYSHENAHNFFAQQFAELGLVGGLLFVWLVGFALWSGWRAVRSGGADAAALALLAGCVGYAITCVTGHPLLVPEAALPFWGALGLVAGAGVQNAPASGRVAARIRVVAALITLLLAANLALQARRHLRADAPPPERGFYGLERGEDGRPFTWMTRHGVFYAGPQAGVLTIPVRAPELPGRTRPFVVSVDVAGWRAGVYTLTPGTWTNVELTFRERAPLPFRRVDLRANAQWSRARDLGIDGDDAPRSVMVGEVRWRSAGGR